MNSTARRTRTRLIAGLSGAVALSVLAVAGCSSSSSGSPASASSSTASAAAATSGAASASPSGPVVPLVVYSAQGYDSAMTRAFTKATGIPVQLDDNSTGPLLTQIEASKNNPKWGLLWVDGPTAFAGLDTQGLLLKGFEPNVSWNSLGTQSVPADKSWVPTGVTLMGLVAYNKNKVSNPPTTLQALESPQWKGQVGMNDPSQSGPTYPLIAGVLPSCIGIDAHASAQEQKEAEEFASYVLSSAGQKVMQTGDPTGDSLYYPVVNGVSPLPSLPSLASVKTQTVNPYTWGNQEATINNWFDSNIVR